MTCRIGALVSKPGWILFRLPLTLLSFPFRLATVLALLIILMVPVLSTSVLPHLLVVQTPLSVTIIGLTGNVPSNATNLARTRETGRPVSDRCSERWSFFSTYTTALTSHFRPTLFA